MQYKIEIIASILFSDSGCSWQQTHSLCVAMVSQRSWVHQNGLSNRSFTSSFSLSLSSALGTRSGAQNGKVDDQPWLRVQTRLPGQNLLDGRTSRLAAWPFSTCSKWRLPMLNFGLLSHWSQKKKTGSSNLLFSLQQNWSQRRNLVGTTFALKLTLCHG